MARFLWETWHERCPHPSRRGLLAAGLAGAAVLVAGAAASPIGANPDAELIAACAEHDRYQAWFLGIHGEGPKAHLYIVDDAERDAACDAAPDTWAMMERICSLRATTIQGFQARARSIIWNSGGHFRESPSQGDQMVEALLIDLAGDDWPMDNDTIDQGAV